MPASKKIAALLKRRFTRDGRRRVRARRKPRAIVPVSNAPFPKIRFAKLVYYEEVQLNPTAGGIAYNVFRTNSLYDPNSTGTGHQPMGFDQLMALYNHYEVYGSKITARFIPSGNQYYCGVYLDDDGSATTNITELLEQRGSRSRILSNSASRPTVVTQRYSQTKTFGKTVRGDDTQKGNSAASPSEMSYFMVYAASVGSTDPGAVTVLVRIEFFAKFSELKTLTQS